MGVLLTSGGWASPGALRGGQTWLWRRERPHWEGARGGGAPPPQVPLTVAVQFLKGKELVVHLHRPQQPVRLLRLVLEERQASWGPHLCADTQALTAHLHGQRLTRGTHHPGCREQRRPGGTAVGAVA